MRGMSHGPMHEYDAITARKAPHSYPNVDGALGGHPGYAVQFSMQHGSTWDAPCPDIYTAMPPPQEAARRYHGQLSGKDRVWMDDVMTIGEKQSSNVHNLRTEWPFPRSRSSWPAVSPRRPGSAPNPTGPTCELQIASHTANLVTAPPPRWSDLYLPGRAAPSPAPSPSPAMGHPTPQPTPTPAAAAMPTYGGADTAKYVQHARAHRFHTATDMERQMMVDQEMARRKAKADIDYDMDVGEWEATTWEQAVRDHRRKSPQGDINEGPAVPRRDDGTKGAAARASRRTRN